MQNEELSPLEVTKNSFKKAMGIINRALDDETIDAGALKTAKFVVQSYKGLQQAENNKKAQERESKRFNHKLFEMYGNEQQKEHLKKVFNDQFKDMKFIK